MEAKTKVQISTEKGAFLIEGAPPFWYTMSIRGVYLFYTAVTIEINVVVISKLNTLFLNMCLAYS